MNSPVLVNGKFLNQPITGVQRYGHGILSQINSNVEVLAAPEGRLASNYWEQTKLPALLKKRGNPLLINFCNSAPSFYKNQIVTIHDLAVFENPKWFQSPFATYYKLLFKRLAKTARHFVTVSEFSKSEMKRHLNIPEDKITIIHSAIDNRFGELQAIKPRIGDQAFILMVGSHDPRKNFHWVIEHAARHINDLGFQLIIAGNPGAAFSDPNNKDTKSVTWLTNASDTELKWLYQNAELVIHPSLYEGFSLIPLEAASLNAKTLISNIPAHREIVGEQALYFDLDDANSLLNELDKALHGVRRELPHSFSFSESTLKWEQLIYSHLAYE